MTEFALDHHASFGLATNAEYVRKGFFASRRLGVLLEMLRRMLSRRRLNRHSELVAQIKTAIISCFHNLHVLVENVQWRISFAKKLLASSHPVFVSALLAL